MASIPLRPTREAWTQRAIAELPTILLDHAHCERKAAQTALKLMARYSDRPRLQMQLSRLAREELVHFERVLRELDLRGLTFGPLSSGAYAATLFKEIAAPGEELLCSALIEARSHERFVQLAAVVPDVGLKALYEDLLEAEERHGNLYIDLWNEVIGTDPTARLDALCAREDEIVHRPRQALRMHSGG
ncbi:MAG: tRNA isopentenyl-2-thiomethyl-A-37 hydroxylase MiaE [Polyangia bacterium]